MSLPESLCEEAARLLEENYADLLAEGERLGVSGSLSSDEAEVHVLLEGGPRGARVEASTRVRVPEGAADADEALDRAMDAADAFLGEWLEEGRAERHPIDFVEYTFDDRPVGVRMRIRHPAVEAEADRWLASTDGGSDEAYDPDPETRSDDPDPAPGPRSNGRGGR